MIDAIEALIKQNQDATDENNSLLEALVVQTQKNDNKDELEAIAKANIDTKRAVKRSNKEVVAAINGLKPIEVKGLNAGDLTTALLKLLKGEDGYTPIKDKDYKDGDKGDKGEPGYTPEKGKDYFTNKEVEEIIKSVGNEIPVPKDGYTPVKGKDYFDGEDGKTGDDAVVDYKLIVDLVSKKFPKIKTKEKSIEEIAQELVGKLSYDDLKDLPNLNRLSARDYDFLELKDVPKSYQGQKGKFLKVNDKEDGLEYGEGDGTGDMLKTVYDPAGGEKQVAFADDLSSFLKIDQTTPQTTVGTFTFPKTLIGADANFTDFPNTTLVASKGDSGHSYTNNIGIVGESLSAIGYPGIGVGGVSKTNGIFPAYGVAGRALVDASASSGAAIGVQGLSESTHTGGSNISFWASATGGLLNYSFYGNTGTLFNTDTIQSLADVRTPLIIGGTAVGSNIIYKSTTGAGTTAGIAHQWTGGTNGGTVIATMLNNGNIGIGTTAPVSKLTIQDGASAYAELDGSFDTALGIAADTSLISGMDFKNFNTAGQVRLMARNDQNDYIVVNSPGSTSNATFFGQTSNTMNALFSQGATDTDKFLAIGTINAGDLLLGTKNTERMRISSTGNVGIGTTNPVATLQVNTPATTSAGNGVRINRPGSTYYSGLEYTTNGTVDWAQGVNSAGFGIYEFGLAATTRLLIQAGGNVGIGTTNPTARLSIDNLGVNSNLIKLLNSSNTYSSLIQFNRSRASSANLQLNDKIGGFEWTPTFNGQNTQEVAALTAYYTGDGTTRKGDFAFFTSNSAASEERMRITSTGNVGIGTGNSTIKSQLEVLTTLNGTGTQTVATLSRHTTDFPSNSGVGLSFYHTNSLVGGIAGIRKDASVDWSGDLAFYVNTYSSSTAFSQLSESMRLKYDGKIGINTTTPTNRLDVRGTAATDAIRSAIGFDIYGVPYPIAPTATLAAGGSVDTGTHSWALTYLTALGETNGGLWLDNFNVTTGNNTVILTIPVSTDTRVIGRRIYRTKAGQSGNAGVEYKLVDILNNTATTYTDTASDASLTGTQGGHYQAIDTTTNYITVGGVKAMVIDKNRTTVGFNNVLNTIGSENAFFGNNIAPGSTNLSQCSMFGSLVCPNVTSAGGTTAMGYAALYNSTNNVYNTAIGTLSLVGITTGGVNTAIGFQSGRYTVAGTPNALSEYSVYLGAKTRASASGATNENVIGNGAYGSGSNTTTIGNTSITQTYIKGNLNVPTAIIGTSTNNTTFEADGTMVMNGNATVWEDLRFPATAINPAGAPSAMVFDTTNIGFTAGAAGTQVIAVIAQMPHSWKEGSDIYPHIHWEPITTNTGNVLWRIEYKWTNIGDTEPAGFTTLDVLDAGDGTALKHQIASFAAMSGTGKTISSIITIKVSRIGGDATDTYTGDALLKEFDIHYESDGLGSRSEFIK